MKMRNHLLALLLGLSAGALAQAPAGAPSGATGQCTDGSYSTQATKRGACRGHQGVKQWFAVPTFAPSAASSSTSAAAAAQTPATAPAPPMGSAASDTKPMTRQSANPANMAQAPGGGPGMVWLNSSTNVYHCSGDRYYGKAKAGKYESEADANATGAHPARGKACS